MSESFDGAACASAGRTHSTYGRAAAAAPQREETRSRNAAHAPASPRRAPSYAATFSASIRHTTISSNARFVSPHALHGGRCRFSFRVAVSTGRYRRKCDRADVRSFARDAKHALVGLGEERRLRRPAVPDRTDRVDDPARGELIAGGEDRPAGRQPRMPPAFFEQLGPGRSMDGAVDAAAAAERFVRGVDDRIDVDRGDAGPDDGDHAACVRGLQPRGPRAGRRWAAPYITRPGFAPHC